MARWLRLEDARHLARGDAWLHAELSRDVPGIYISDDLTRYKVFYDALERDARSRLHRRQRTRTFRRDEAHDIDGEPVDALTAARDFKSRRAVEVMAQREQAKDVTVADLFAMFVESRPLRPSTVDVYRYVFAKHVAPALGAWSLQNLDVHAVERWYADLEAGPEAKAKAARLLRALTAFGHRRGMIRPTRRASWSPPARDRGRCCRTRSPTTTRSADSRTKSATHTVRSYFCSRTAACGSGRPSRCASTGSTSSAAASRSTARRRKSAAN